MSTTHFLFSLMMLSQVQPETTTQGIGRCIEPRGSTVCVHSTSTHGQTHARCCKQRSDQKGHPN